MRDIRNQTGLMVQYVRSHPSRSFNHPIDVLLDWLAHPAVNMPIGRLEDRDFLGPNSFLVCFYLNVVGWLGQVFSLSEEKEQLGCFFTWLFDIEKSERIDFIP